LDVSNLFRDTNIKFTITVAFNHHHILIIIIMGYTDICGFVLQVRNNIIQDLWWKCSIWTPVV